MMRLAMLLAALVVSGCAGAPVFVDPAAGGTGARDRSVPISSTLRGGPADIAGDWVIGPSLTGAGLGAPGGLVRLTQGEAGMRWQVPQGDRAIAFDTVLTGPSRYRMVSRGGAPLDLWVLWVDDGFRTAVVGTPDGRFGWIMDRPGQASRDRTVAAREILDFNGYDLARFGP